MVNLRKVGRVSTVSWKINRTLLGVGLPTARPIQVRVLRRDHVKPMREALKVAIIQEVAQPRAVQLWLARRLKFVVASDRQVARRSEGA